MLLHRININNTIIKTIKCLFPYFEGLKGNINVKIFLKFEMDYD